MSNQYEVKREQPHQRLPSTVGNDNPFLRRPKSIKVNVKRLDSIRKRNIQNDNQRYVKEERRGQAGWVPIPYPVYKK